MKKAIEQKKVAYKKMCKNRLEKNKARYINIKNQTKKWFPVHLERKLKKS